MKRIRIGKDINVQWVLHAPTGVVLTAENLTIELKKPKGSQEKIDTFTLETSQDKFTVNFTLRGTAFSQLGSYTFTAWLNKGEQGQSVVDAVNAFTLVGSTQAEDNLHNCGCGCLNLATVDLQGDISFVGRPGYSPTANVVKEGDTVTITITDKDGTTTATVKDGKDGDDGVSPAVSIETIQGGHQVTITDAEHPQGQSFDVMDGQDVTEIFWATYGTTTASEIQAAIDAGKAVMCKHDNKLYTTVVKTTTQFAFGATIGGNNYYAFVNLSTNAWGASNKLIPSVITSNSSEPTNNNVFSALYTKSLVDAVDSKIEGPWTKLVDTILEEDTTNTGLSVKFNKNCSKLKIIAVFPANASLSSNTSCYLGLTGRSGSTTLICGSGPLRSTPVKVIAEYTYADGLGWQGVLSQFANATNEDGNNAYSVVYTNLRGANVGAVYSVRIYGNNVPLIAGTKIQIWGK